ncbi:MAG: MBL fold metallo-hydrolase [Desulfuromonadales bacterium]
MHRSLPLRYVEPTFFAGLFDDPVLYLKIRPMGRALLLDCGRIDHLAKRVLKSIDALFVTHAHMDHFMGIDTFIRNVHVSPRTIELFGPPGIAAKLEHKLAGYDWNLAEENWCTFRVREIAGHVVTTYLLPGAEGFACRFEGHESRLHPVVYGNRWLRLSAAACYHKIPSLIYRLDERPPFSIDDDKLAEKGLVRGEWLRELNRRVHEKTLDAGPLRVLREDDTGSVAEQRVTDAASLYREIRGDVASASLGYVTDVGYTEANIETMTTLLRGVDLLVIECTFLREDRDKARASHHLCTDDVKDLVRRLQPQAVLPMHLSKSCIGRLDELYRELDLPPGTEVIRLPEHIAPRPLLPAEVEDMLKETN